MSPQTTPVPTVAQAHFIYTYEYVSDSEETATGHESYGDASSEEENDSDITSSIPRDGLMRFLEDFLFLWPDNWGGWMEQSDQPSQTAWVMESVRSAMNSFHGMFRASDTA